MKYSGEMPLAVSPSLAVSKMVSNDGGVLDSEMINPALKFVHEDELHTDLYKKNEKTACRGFIK